MPAVPDVTGLPPVQAFAALREAGLRPVLLGVPAVKSDGRTGYRVAVQDPAAAEPVDDGARVCLALALRPVAWGSVEGPPVVPAGTPAPDVVGVELEAAMLRVTELGLVAVVHQPERAVTALEVSRQAPDPGEPASFREVLLWLD